MNLDTQLVQSLQKEIPILRAQIQALYQELDRKLGLQGAEVPVTFGFDENLLGSYTPPAWKVELLGGSYQSEKEHFHFSLLFAGYSVQRPLSKEDRMDLFRHEYAHYMQYNMDIPKEYLWQPGIHGSAWKYCCSLVGAVPTPYYKAGEALMKHDYDKVLKNPIHDKTIPMRDTYRREQEYRKSRDSVVRYQIGDEVEHPTFGKGIIEEVTPQSGSVRLRIRFTDKTRLIDQKWLLRTGYK